MDNFYEQLVTTKKNATYSVANTSMYVSITLAAFFIGINIIFGVILIGIGVGLFFVKRNLYLEYEYDFTNGDIDIDKIIEMKSRKRVISFNVKDVELLAPLNSDDAKSFSNKPSEVLKLYPSTSKEKLYVAMVTGGPKRVQIIFVPNQKFVDICFKYNPKAVKRFL